MINSFIEFTIKLIRSAIALNIDLKKFVILVQTHENADLIFSISQLNASLTFCHAYSARFLAPSYAALATSTTF